MQEMKYPYLEIGKVQMERTNEFQQGNISWDWDFLYFQLHEAISHVDTINFMLSLKMFIANFLTYFVCSINA